MRVTRKIALLQIFVVCLFVGMAGFIGQRMWGDSYLQLEQEEVKDNMVRVQLSWQEELKQLETIVGDWAPWDDLYAFVSDPTVSSFVEKNLTDGAMVNLRVNAVVITDVAGRPIFAKAINLESKNEQPVSADLALTATHLVNLHMQGMPDGQNISGFLMVGDRPMLFALQHILTSEQKGPSNGTLIFAKYADEHLLQAISHRTQVGTGFTNTFAPENYVKVNLFYQDVQEKEVRAFAPLKDLDGKENFALISSTPRSISIQGQSQSRSFMLMISLFGVLMIGFTLGALDLAILRRVRRLRSFIHSIGKDHDYSGRLVLPGNDEISQAAYAMNDMLAHIERSHEENNRLYQAVQAELEERRKTEEMFRYWSLHDTLTGLHNRAHFEAELDRLARRRTENVGIICCDLDGLKLINDTLGHQAGDCLLVRAANVLRDTFTDNAIVARIGGDEFAVLLPDADKESVVEASHKLRLAIDGKEVTPDGLSLSLSIGWAQHSGFIANEEVLRTVLKRADDRMYRQKLSNSQSSHNKLVQGMLELLKVRDYITEGHSQRLQRHVTALGRASGLNDTKIADLCLLAQFHDIGKVGISDSILLKPGKLTPEERKEMERHSEIGSRIAQTIPELQPISDYILKHHEWWNGEGYPQQLRGEEIPIEDRILAIADAFDAMTNKRPYREAMTIQAALDEIRIMAGVQFDPELAEAFISMVKDDQEFSV